jgi:hypothetical protein
MKAVAWFGKEDVRVIEVAVPLVTDPVSHIAAFSKHRSTLQPLFTYCSAPTPAATHSAVHLLWYSETLTERNWHR